MKLVDILARELKVWPEDSWAAVGQSNVGSLHEVHPPADRLRWTDELYSMASDWTKAEVTRAQWQAAVDALKKAENAVPEWNGEGLPPVGTVCEVDGSSGPTGWAGCTIRYVSDDVIVFKRAAYGFESFSTIGEYSFRPIRTPEQIAAEVRRVEIKHIQAASVVNCGPYITESAAGAIYDAGYRKFEIVDN